MKLLLEGSLNETLMLKDLLTGILQAEAPGVSVLQLFVEGNDQYGEIFFLGGHFVVGSSLSATDIPAQESFNHLLQLKEAKFYYYACDSLEALPANKPLKIDLKELLDNWQVRMPVSSNDIMDKIFNKGEPSQDPKAIAIATENIDPESVVASKPFNKKEISHSPFSDKQSDIDWELVNPLLIGGAPGDTAIGTIGNEWEENPSSTHDLRSLAAGPQWQRKLRDLCIIIIMLSIALVVILCFSWLLMNSPSSENSKHFSAPLWRHGGKRTFNHTNQH